MKKERRVICTALALVMVLSLAACHKGNEDPINTPDPTAEPEPTPMETINDFYDDLDEEKAVDSFLSDEFIKSNFDIEETVIRNVHESNDTYWEGYTKEYSGAALDLSSPNFVDLILKYGNSTMKKPIYVEMSVQVKEAEAQEGKDTVYRILSNYLNEEVISKLKESDEKANGDGAYNGEYQTDSGVVEIYFRELHENSQVSVFKPDDDAEKQVEEYKEFLKEMGSTQEEIDDVSIEMFGQYATEAVDVAHYSVSVGFVDFTTHSFTPKINISAKEKPCIDAIPGMTVESDLNQANIEEFMSTFGAESMDLASVNFISTGEEDIRCELLYDVTSKDGSQTECSINSNNYGSFDVAFKSGYYDSPCNGAAQAREVAKVLGFDETSIGEAFDGCGSMVKELENGQTKVFELESDTTFMQAKFTYVEFYGYFIDYLIYRF